MAERAAGRLSLICSCEASAKTAGRLPLISENSPEKPKSATTFRTCAGGRLACSVPMVNTTPLVCATCVGRDLRGSSGDRG